MTSSRRVSLRERMSRSYARLSALVAAVAIGASLALLPSVAGAAASWQTPIQVGSTFHQRSVTCPSINLCWDGGNVGTTTGSTSEWTGSSWSAPAATFPHLYGIYAVACASTTLCWAVGTAGYMEKWNGTSWTTLQKVTSGSWVSVTCASSTLCWAGGRTGELAKWNGTTWSVQSGFFAVTRSISALSCAAATRCVAAGAYGEVRLWNGSTWSAAAFPSSSTTSFTAASCPSNTLCWVSGEYQTAYKWNGSSWSQVAISGDSPISISCPSVTECWGVTGGGAALEWTGGSTWTRYAVDSTRTINSVSCPSVSECWAVDNTGYAIELVTTTTSGSGVAASSTTPLGVGVRATANITPGALAFVTTPASLAWSWTENGHAAIRLPMVGTTEALGIADARGSGAGWSVDLTSTTFAVATTTHTLPNTAASVQTAPAAYVCTATDFGGCTVGQNSTSYPYTVPASSVAPTAMAVATAAITTGMGDQTISVPFDLTIPASAYAGTYQSVWTFSLISGP